MNGLNISGKWPQNLLKHYKKTFAQFNIILVQLKVSKIKTKLIKTLELSLFWRNRIQYLLMIRKTWYASMMKTKGTQGPFTIDRRIIALDTYELLYESRHWYDTLKKEETVAKKNMKLWKINCWRKVPLEMLCLVVEWNQTHQTLYQKNLMRKPSTLTNQLISQTGTYGPVMLRRWKRINYNLRWTPIYLKTFQDRMLKGWIQIISRLI